MRVEEIEEELKQLNIQMASFTVNAKRSAFSVSDIKDNEEKVACD